MFFDLASNSQNYKILTKINDFPHSESNGPVETESQRLAISCICTMFSRGKNPLKRHADGTTQCYDAKEFHQW